MTVLTLPRPSYSAYGAPWWRHSSTSCVPRDRSSDDKELAHRCSLYHPHPQCLIQQRKQRTQTCPPLPTHVARLHSHQPNLNHQGNSRRSSQIMPPIHRHATTIHTIDADAPTGHSARISRSAPQYRLVFADCISVLLPLCGVLKLAWRTRALCCLFRGVCLLHPRAVALSTTQPFMCACTLCRSFNEI